MQHAATSGPGRLFVPFIAALIALGPFAIDTYLPALPTMAEALDTSIVRVNQTLSIYLFGFAIGQLIGGPASDQVGRRVVGLIGLVIFVACSIAIAMTDNINHILALRGLQAIGGGFATVICMAMVRDSYSAAEAARQFPKIMMVMLTAPLIAPAIGAALVPLGWASIFVFLAGYGLLLALALGISRETLTSPPGRLQLQQIFPQYLRVVRYRIHDRLVPLRYILTQGMMASVLMIFITNSSFIYMDYYAVPANHFVFYFAANVVAMMFGNLTTTRLIRWHTPFTLYTWGRSIQFAIMIMLTVLVTFTEPPVWQFTPLLALLIGTNGVIGPAAQGLYLAPFRELSGSATSLLNTSVFFFGSIMGAATGLFYDGTLRPIIWTMLAALVIGNLLAMSIPRTEPSDHE